MSKKAPTVKEHAELKYEQAIKVLNVLGRYKIDKSEIHGVGVIATDKIRKGNKLWIDATPELFDLPYSKFKHLRKPLREEILGKFPLIIGEKSNFLYPNALMSAYLNHSDNPNYCGKTDKALRQIKEGDEITEDYRTIKDYKKIYKWLK